MFDEIRPFELLKLIRDGVVTSRADFHSAFKSAYVNADTPLAVMAKLGWIEIMESGEIKPTELIVESQNALRLSLTQLAPFGSKSVVTNPIFGRPKESSHSSDLFVLMPFVTELRPVFFDHICAVAEKLSLSAARADDFFAANTVISDVWNAIVQARVLIADCTGRNPNVFYELGISHTLGKRPILIAQNQDDIPFDIQHLRTIFYEFTPKGMREFETALESAIKQELELPLAYHADVFAESKNIEKNINAPGQLR